jgi:hypothetical protein
VNRLLILLFLIPVIAKAQATTLRTINTTHGTVTFKEVEYPSKDADRHVATIVGELTVEELKKMDSDAEKAPAFIAKYVPSSRRDKDLLENLDSAFAAWLHASNTNKESAENVTRIIGAAYGRYCISHLGVRWAVAADDYGIDVALVRENPTTRSFPFSSIRYRIEDKKTDFIYALYASTKQVIDEAK